MFGTKSSSPADKDHGVEDPLLMTTHEVAGLHSSSPNAAVGRWKLLLIMLACAAPVIASYFTYYVIRPTSVSSYGTLIPNQPVIPAVPAVDLDGNAHSLLELRKQWLLVSVGPSSCDQACEQRLYLQRQIRESMGPDKARVDWVWLITDQEPVRDALKPALEQAIAWRVSPDVLAQWLRPDADQALQDHLYVVDPMGNWMMRFPANPDPKLLRKDITRLLKASQFWDTEGRTE